MDNQSKHTNVGRKHKRQSSSWVSMTLFNYLLYFTFVLLFDVLFLFFPNFHFNQSHKQYIILLFIRSTTGYYIILLFYHLPQRVISLFIISFLFISHAFYFISCYLLFASPVRHLRRIYYIMLLSSFI